MIQKVHSGYISEVNKNSNSKRYTHLAKVYGSFIYNSQDMETIQVSINRRTDIHDAGCVGVCSGEEVCRKFIADTSKIL